MKLFEKLKAYSVILVTGPQRSGTTICARMIEHDTGYTYIDEARFRVSDVQEARKVISYHKENQWPCVVQAPGLFRWANEIEIDYYSCIVVVMKRTTFSLIQSYKRNPTVVKGMLEIWPEAIQQTYQEKALAHIPYNHWEREVKPKIRHWMELDYPESIENHPMWVPREEREGWTKRQYAKSQS